MTEGVGTIYAMAPQVLWSTSQADLWSTGVIAYMSTGVIAYMLLSNTKPFYFIGRNVVMWGIHILLNYTGTYF